MAEQVVDIEVSRAKFADEVAQWRDRGRAHGQRGILLVDAEFPTAFAVFALPGMRPTHLLFGVELDFTNYDLWPPSVRFVDPLTREPWPPGVVTPTNILLNGKPAPLFLRFVADENQPGTFSVQQPVLSQANQGPAFLCMRGVREYHEHPAHSGDAWLQYRGTGIGSLFYLLDKLHEFSIGHIAGMQVGLTYFSGGVRQILPTPPGEAQQ